MCQGKTAIKCPMFKAKEKKSVWVVLHTLSKEAEEPFGNGTAFDFVPMKIFASHLMAKVYCERRAREAQFRHDFSVVDWVNDDTVILYKTGMEDDTRRIPYARWEIHETDIDDEIPADFHYPQIEKENKVLREECWNLRKQLADVKQRNAVAATYATMWDGGRDYTKEHVLQNLNTVRDVLAGDHAKVRELYEAWKKKEANQA